MTTDDEAMRDFTKRLFSHPEEADQPLAPRGHVRREGDNPDPSPADPMRDYVGRLFGTDENSRGLNNTPLD